MAINERLVHTASAVGSGAAEAEQGLILHLDANDVDSYDGNGSVWYDISEYDVLIPLSDNADDLELHLNASDATSYGGTGTTWTDLTSNNNATVSASTYDIDNGGYFDITSNTISFSSNTSALDGTTFSFEMWVYQTTNSGTQYLFSDLGISFFTISGTQMRFIKYLSGTNNDTGYFNPTSNGSGWATNKWNHIAVTFSSYTSSIYINGVLVDAESLGSGTGTALTTLQISPSDGRWKGYLGAFRVYDIALSASEIGQNYRHGRDYVYTDLIDDTDLELHLDADSFPEKGESGYSNTPSTWTDSSSNSNNGTITGAAFDSELGNWLDFDGSNDYVSIPSTSTTPIDFTSKSYSIECWVNIDSNTTHPILAKYGTTDSLRSTNFSITAGGNLSLYERIGGGGQSSLSTSALSLNTWRHVCVVRKSSQVEFYIDGELDNTVAATSTPNSGGAQNINIGSQANGNYSFLNGKIGQVRVYSSALTQDAIRQNFNFTKSSYPNGNNGTISGATFLPSGVSFDFDGNDKVTLPSTFLKTTKIFSVAVWVKFDTISQNFIGVIENFAANVGGWSIDMPSSTSKLPRFFFYNGSSYTIAQGTTALTTGQWYHLCGTASGSEAKLYVDDTLVATTAYSTPMSNTNQAVIIGGDGVSTNYLDGKISDVKIYDRAIELSEVQALHGIGYNGIE